MDAAASVAECISPLAQAGLENAAERVAYLKAMADGDPDSDPPVVASVREAVRFLLGRRLPTDPTITASDNGLVYLSWEFGERGVLEMRFMPSGLVAFAAVLYDSDSKRHGAGGTMTPDGAMDAAGPICAKLFGSWAMPDNDRNAAGHCEIHPPDGRGIGDGPDGRRRAPGPPRNPAAPTPNAGAHKGFNSEPARV